MRLCEVEAALREVVAGLEVGGVREVHVGAGEVEALGEHDALGTLATVLVGIECWRPLRRRERVAVVV